MKRFSLALVFCIIFWGTFFSGVIFATEYILKDLPQLDNGIVIFADVLDVGTDQLIVGKGDRVLIYDQDMLVGEITGFSGNVTALAAGDMNGNFHYEIIVGTDAFNVHIYQLINGEWLQLDVKRYFWAPIRSIKAADITGNGWGDLLITNTRGEAYIYLSWEGKLDIFWRSKPNEPVKFMDAAPLTGAEFCDVVLTQDSGYIEVLGWRDEKLRTLWQGYPWGTIESLLLAPLQGQGFPWIVVYTDQNMFYSWRWNGNSFAAVHHLHQKLEGKIINYHPDFGLITAAPGSGITTYEVGPSSLDKTSHIQLPAINDIFFYNHQAIVEDSGHRYYSLYAIESPDMEIYINGTSVQNIPEFVTSEGKIYVELEGLASALGWLKFGTKQKIILLRGLNYLVVDGERGAILWHNIPLPVEETINLDNRVYLPVDSIRIFGYEIELDCVQNRLDLYSNWGWW